MSFYGSEFWIDTKGAVKQFHVFCVSYHYALKKILNLQKRLSNHNIHRKLGVKLFMNLFNYNLFDFILSLSDCSSPCFEVHKAYFLKKSSFMRCTSIVFFENYGFINILEDFFLLLLSESILHSPKINLACL